MEKMLKLTKCFLQMDFNWFIPALLAVFLFSSAGIGAGVGLQFDNIQTGLGHNMGFANLTNTSEIQMKNNGFALTLTYIFGK